MNRIKSFIKYSIHIILCVCFYPFPVRKRKVVFNSFYGRGFGDNPKYIANELIRRKFPCDMVWLLRNMDDNLPTSIRKVKYNRIRCAYELATAKIIVSNVKGDLFFIKKKSQYYIQTWHGSFGLKYIEADAIKKLSKGYIRRSKNDSKNTDLFISNSHLQSEEYKRALWCESLILECGAPRNDLLFSNVNKERIRDRIGIPHSHKVVLYAPTFRDNHQLSCYRINANNLLNTFLKFFGGGNCVLLVRFHPGATQVPDFFVSDNNVINVSAYQDTQELLLIADVLITDYSSIMLDYVILRRPIFIFATDIEEYEQMRGLKPIFYELPFDICKTEGELLEKISQFDNSQYQKKLNSFFDLYSPYDNGTASRMVVDKMISIIN